MGWENLREFHDCYLHTDVLALADVMESYRDSFRVGARPNPLCHVARSRLGRHATQDCLLNHLRHYLDFIILRIGLSQGLSAFRPPFDTPPARMKVGKGLYGPHRPARSSCPSLACT